MKKTYFISKKQAQEFIDPIGQVDRVLISITTPNVDNFLQRYYPAELDAQTWKEILRLEFHDVDPSHLNTDETSQYRLFDEGHAVQILKFLKKHQVDTQDAIVHCEAGISRSAGVSKFIAHIYSLQFLEHYSLYNKHIFSTLLRVYGECLYGQGPIPIEDLPGLKGDAHDS